MLAHAVEPGRNLLQRHLLGGFNAAGSFGGFVIPAFIIQRGKGLLQLGYLGQQDFALLLEQGQAGINGAVALHGKLDIGADIFDGHARAFQAGDHPQPFHIAFLEHADAAGRPHHKGQQALFIVIAQGRGGNIQHAGHFANGIQHRSAAPLCSKLQKNQKKHLT